MEVQQSIKVLKSKGWSDRRIARELGINRRAYSIRLTVFCEKT